MAQAQCGTVRQRQDESVGSVDLLWIPLGAGSRIVQSSGRLAEALLARRQHRSPVPLFHSALVVRSQGRSFAVEMAPAWQGRAPAAAIVGTGAVGSRLLGRSRVFRYDVRCWQGGLVPDAHLAVGASTRVGDDAVLARRLVALAGTFPTAVWGRDDQDAGGIWSSNSLIAWLLARSGHRTVDLRPPGGGAAPGWHAGLVVARRTAARSVSPLVL